MNRLLMIGAAGLIAGSTAAAEVTVSVTITGSFSEMAELLEALKPLMERYEEAEGMRVEMHSQSTEEVPPAFGPVQVEPAEVAPGATVRVKAVLEDRAGKVDTVVATLESASMFDFDLYDNGTHGDEVAGDGVWTYDLEVPPTAGAGNYPVTIRAYDRSGDPVMAGEGENAAPLVVSAEFSVRP